MIGKKELIALKKDINKIGQKLDQLIDAYEQNEAKTPKSADAKTAKANNTQKRARKENATDKVLKIINRSKKGVDIATLVKKTGFDQRKVRNIIFRTHKEGRIKRADRGVYVGVK